MQFKISANTIDWWFWAITLLFILVGLGGATPGYYAVMAISGFQVIYFTWQNRSLVAFSVQVRIFYGYVIVNC